MTDAESVSPIRVTLVTHYYASHRGGVELVAWELASRLARSGVADITWWASDTDAPPEELPRMRARAARACNVFERRLKFPFPLWSPAALLALVRSVRACDVVHLHDCVYLPNVVAWAAAKLYRRPVVVTQHVGLVPYRNRLLRTAHAGANAILGRMVLGSAAQCVFVSEVVRRYFAGFVAFQRAPLRLPNGVDVAVFRPAGDDERHRLRSALDVGDSPLLLFVGRFVEKKGLPMLQRLAAALPQACWIFAGWGPLDPGAWRLANVSVRYNAGRDELARLYQAADLLVLPSVGEGFPLVVQEAMACGTPALVTDETAAGCPEAADVLLSEPLGSGWAARIEHLLRDPQRLRAMRARVAQYARANWSWERCAERYAEVLRACVS